MKVENSLTQIKLTKGYVASPDQALTVCVVK